MAEQSNTSSTTQPKLGEPFCSNCGHRLTGLTDSSKCPECGKPIVEVLTRRSVRGRRYRSETTLFGLPLIDIAYGPSETELYGKPRGIIAIGDRARGLIAMGGTATGLVAFGGRAIGVFAFGGIALGLLGSWGGLSLGLLASGGLAVGGLAFGGAAAGFAASGGVSAGYYAMGGAPFGIFRIGPGVSDQQAVDFLQNTSWYFGPGSLGLGSFIQPILCIGLLAGCTAFVILMLAVLKHMRASRKLS